MRHFHGLLLGLLLTGCEVDMAPNMLKGDLLREMREPELMAELCGGAPKEPIGVLSLTVDDIQAKRPLFGSEGHGSAQVTYPQQGGPVCKAKVTFDFSQDSKTFRSHGRVVGTSNKFFFGNVKLTKS
jgi:hypothetical protein